MILLFESGVDESVVRDVTLRLQAAGLRALRGPEPRRAALVVPEGLPPELAAELEAEPTLTLVQPHEPWRLVHRALRDAPSVVRIGGPRGVAIGGGSVAVIAGPCSVEGRQAVLEAAHHAREAGAQLLRGGAFKPRTSPYAFRGYGVEGLAQLKAAGVATGMPVVSEIMDASDLPAFVDHDIDCLQIGARNMQNFTLLAAVAGAERPVLLKRGLAATVEEWLLAAEHLAAAGCSQIVLCERGIRTFETATRNTLDLTVLPLLHEWTHLPVVVDPSHAAGIARIIPPLARASITAGADGLALEMHLRPEVARSDAAQALLPGELARIMADVRVLVALDGRRLSPAASPACSAPPR